MRDITIHKCKYAADWLTERQRNENSNWNGIVTKQKSLSNHTESSIYIYINGMMLRNGMWKIHGKMLSLRMLRKSGCDSSEYSDVMHMVRTEKIRLIPIKHTSKTYSTQEPNGPNHFNVCILFSLIRSFICIYIYICSIRSIDSTKSNIHKHKSRQNQTILLTLHTDSSNDVVIFVFANLTLYSRRFWCRIHTSPKC